MKEERVIGKLGEMNAVWSVLSDEEMKFACSNLQVCHFHKNDIIHQEGDIPTDMMMLVSGKIKIYKEGISQRQQIIRLLKPYDIFSYRALVGGGEYGSCAAALETSIVYKLNKTAFLHLLQHNNEFCFRMMQSMASDLGIQELKTINLTQKHIRARLAESLLNLKHNYGLDEDGVTIAMYMSREDLANMSNMTTSNAIRTLSQFAQEGLVNVDGRKIKIHDEEGLIKISRLG